MIVKVYCAGPLFTLYERDYMSRCGQALREVGIKPFVPHENFHAKLPPDTAERLLALGAATPEMLEQQPLGELVRRLIQTRIVSREELGLPLSSTAQQVFDRDFEALSDADAVLAVINGTEADDGTACEIGIFAALMESDPSKKGIVAIHDDWRTLDAPGEGKGLNAFVQGCLLQSGVIVKRLEDAVIVLEGWRGEEPGQGPGRGASA